jgi:hypothetical protein
MMKGYTKRMLTNIRKKIIIILFKSKVKLKDIL